MPNGCLAAFMAIIFARLAGRQRGTWIRLVSLARRAPSERRSALALPSRARSASPLPHLLLHSSYKQPARKGPGARTRAPAPRTCRAAREAKRGEARPGSRSPRASPLCTRRIYTPGRAGPLRGRPAPPRRLQPGRPARCCRCCRGFEFFFVGLGSLPAPSIPSRPAGPDAKGCSRQSGAGKLTLLQPSRPPASLPPPPLPRRRPCCRQRPISRALLAPRPSRPLESSLAARSEEAPPKSPDGLQGGRGAASRSPGRPLSPTSPPGLRPVAPSAQRSPFWP